MRDSTPTGVSAVTFQRFSCKNCASDDGISQKLAMIGATLKVCSLITNVFVGVLLLCDHLALPCAFL
uniref:Uncharacterized protein n=1 Tax=Panagrellus redivivus TaxID=6233 RepID=A0A7E4ZYA4_PANRE